MRFNLVTNIHNYNSSSNHSTITVLVKNGRHHEN